MDAASHGVGILLILSIFLGVDAPVDAQTTSSGEQRSPFVLKRNDSLEIKLSGRIHRMIQTVEDGRETDVFFTDSAQGPTILRFDVTAEPGTEFTYNSANSQLLMLILQRTTGRAYADYVSEKLWQPA